MLLVVEKYVLPMRFAHVMEHVLEKKQVKALVQKDIKLVLDEMVPRFKNKSIGTKRLLEPSEEKQLIISKSTSRIHKTI